MAGEVGAQRVRGVPPHLSARVRRQHPDNLLHKAPPPRTAPPRPSACRADCPPPASSMKYRMICGLTSCSPILVRINVEASATILFCRRRYLSRSAPYCRTGTLVRGPVKRSMSWVANCYLAR